jgi:heat shock protein HtpX
VTEQIAANKHKARLIAAAWLVVWFVVFAAIGIAIGGIVIGLIVGVVVAACATAVVWTMSTSVALGRTNAVPADEVKHARLFNLVEGLCIGSGLPQPSLYVVDDPAPNALTLGRNTKGAALVVTTGLLDKMNRVELEGVVAHELSHIRNLDILPMTIAVTMVPIPSLRVKIVGERELDADAAGVLMTRYPPGLIAALQKLDDDHTEMHAPSKVIAHLWIEAPTAPHPPLADRIRALEGF